jgi:serine protease Do
MGKPLGDAVMKKSITVILVLLPFLLGGLSTGRAMDDGQESSNGGWLGVSITDMTPKLARSMHVKTNEGALVREVVGDSPAEQAGIKADDIIVDFNGTKIVDADELLAAVRSTKPGTSVSILISRKDKEKNMKATLDKAPKAYGFHVFPRIPHIPHIEIPPLRFTMSSSMNTYGLWLHDLTKQLGMYFGAPGGRGVLVEEVEKGSFADSAGFQAGDVIVKVQDNSIARTSDIRDALEDMKERETASVEVIRRGTPKNLSLRVDAAPRHGRCYRYHSFGLPGFESEEFKHQMEELKDELKDMGRQIESQTRQWGKKLREDLQRRSI